MLLSDLLDYLSFNALSQLAIGTDDHGQISTKNYPKLFSFINLALVDVHTRFPLKSKEVILRVDDHQTRYKLHSKYARSKNVVDTPYILDSTDNPFTDDIIIIEDIVNEEGQQYYLNEHDEDFSVFTPQFNEIQLGTPYEGKIAVIYRASHPKIPLKSNVIVDSFELDIPEVLLNPIMTFIAAKFMASKSTAEGLQESALFTQQYNQQLTELTDAGLLPVAHYNHDRFKDSGWR